MDIPYQEINSKTIDRWVEEGWEWGKPVSHEEYEKAKAGTWDVKLTPVKFVPHSWLGELKGKRVLGLASGGGQQMPIFAALEAIQAVNKGLCAFPGNILLASHDHELLQTTCNRVIEFQPDGTIIDRLCSYDDYVAWKLAKEA